MRRPAVLLAAALAAALAGRARAGVPPPELSVAAGRTFAVGKGSDGAYDQGGFTLSLAALWPWEDRFRFGVEAFYSDLGEQIKPIVLPDAKGGPSKEYGSVELGHIGTRGAGWRLDVLGPKLGRRARGFATVRYSVHRLLADAQGQVFGARTARGGSIGLGVERAVGPRQTLSLTAAWDQVFNEEVARHFARGGLEWRWRW